MCIGVPARIVSVDGIAGRDENGALVDMTLTGPVAPGTWVLTHLGLAREVIDAEQAALVREALDAVAQVMAGGAPGTAFADIDARGPQLPPHLQAARAAGETTG